MFRRAIFGRVPCRHTGQAIHPVLVDKDGKSWKLFSFESKRVA